MESIDSIQINFNENQLILLNICLAFIMFGIALDIRLSDFGRLIKQPKTPVIGLISEYLLLPILTIILVFVFRPPTSIALGMVLISVCPGGSVSNFMVHLSKGNAALSVMLTSVTTLGAIIITPLAFAFWSSFIPNLSDFNQNIQVSVWNMIQTIVQLVFIPVAIGMYVNHTFPVLTKKIERPIQILSMVIFFSFVVFAIIGNYDNIINHVYLVFWIVLIHNGLSLLMGYGFAKMNKQSEIDSRAIAIETGIQNTGLGLILVFNFFDGIGGMALIMAWWGVWHLISGCALAFYWQRKTVGRFSVNSHSVDSKQ